ncbi:MAG: mevalonate kinase [Chlorobi bacterium]|nr:mevalonate kinase [Chlorobiota bacterium]
MTVEKSRSFKSKILLFGEYTLIKGSMALSIPFGKYSGQLLFDTESRNHQSNHYSVAYLLDYLHFLMESGFEDYIDLDILKKDIEQGLIFETNIPISYGLGSSGVIVASVYDTYAFNKTDDLDELKHIFSKMESCYHGKSSGLDPLVSYLNKAILINEKGDLTTVVLPKENEDSNSGIFLIDTKTVGETQPLVSWFLKEFEKGSFMRKIQDILIPANNKCIKHYLWVNFNNVIKDVKAISRFTLENFSPMIPDPILGIWENGLSSDDYYLKLCGSGGGGMMLGFTSKLEESRQALRDFDFYELMSI